ncbi:delta(3,5),delta(2,4)-dienoyl-CoA isomerase 1 [Wolffia australiana]
MAEFKTLEIVQKDESKAVFHIYLNRPDQRNALTLDFFSELPAALSLLDFHRGASAIVLSARGPHFCAGLDLSAFRSLSTAAGAAADDPARRRELLRRQILSLQSAISAVQSCRRPVIAAVHGACLGAGLDLVSACDLRYCSSSSFFSSLEVDLAIVADLGSLQRLPDIVGAGRAAEMALTGRRVTAAEAMAMGLVSAVFADPPAMDAAVDGIAAELAAKSPLAVAGTKAVLRRSRDLTAEQGLDYVATWNAAMLVSPDLDAAVSTRPGNAARPDFAKL